MTDAPIWQPNATQIANANITRFAQRVSAKYGVRTDDYQQLHRWSVENSALFWSELADFTGVIFSRRWTEAQTPAAALMDTRWFVGSKLNFAENLLLPAQKQRAADEAIVFYSENGTRAAITFAELLRQVQNVASRLRQLGVGAGDRVVGYLPNQIETVIAALATAANGAIWSASSPDFGINATCDRFAQITPKVLFATTGYCYNGKWHDRRAAIPQLQKRLSTLQSVVSVPYPAATQSGAVAGTLAWADLVAHNAPDFKFEQTDFDAPLYILYSSGTTGAPKCIVHGAGGTLLQHRKEHALHTDIKAGDRVFYFTTCGWMMWHWLVSALAAAATIVLYDGMPFFPDAGTLWSIAERERVAVFGTSAGYINRMKELDYKPAQRHDLAQLRAVLSTGSPLSKAGFRAIYEDVSRNVCLASISGGTDIISCFVLGNPALPVHAGQIQCAGLGMDMAVFDANGRTIQAEKGELVCRRPFPSMPVAFWGDSDRSKYKKAYFDQYENIWTHGDYAEITPQNGFIIHGRSDATLNPAGVRIGTAEIYRQVELVDEISAAVVVGKQIADDVAVVLFVVLKNGLKLDDQLRTRIKKLIRTNASPRHVPAHIRQVPDIPRTLNGKISELAVKAVVEGQTATNTDALANPECLRHFVI